MVRSAHICLRAILAWAFCAYSLPAHARIGLIVGEPFGSFGTMLPVGHASIYLDNICAENPTHFRRCRPGESGVVVSRYHDLKSQKLDWLAFPAFTFFYGVGSPNQIPDYVTPALEAEVRESYRQANLLEVLPTRIDKHGKPHPPPYGDWEEGIGAAFDRNLLLYSIRTTPEQDAQILASLNADPNHRRYSLGRHNCADFAASLLDIVVPGIYRRNIAADFDMTTPKNLMRLLDAHGRAEPSLDLEVLAIPQLPGSVRRSRPTRGSAELLLKTKRYLFTLAIIQPEIMLTDWILYTARGRWTPGRDATAVTPSDLSSTFLARTLPTLPPPDSVNPSKPSETATTPVDTGDLNSKSVAYLPLPITNLE
jgi:hypothetical protein